MMEKLVQAGEGGGARPPPFNISNIKHKVVMYAPAERADTLPLFLLYPLYVLGGAAWKVKSRDWIADQYKEPVQSESFCHYFVTNITK